MKESTEKFLRSNARNRQTSMKSWEFCSDGQRPGAAIREIKGDLLGRPIIINMDHIISFDYNTEKGRYFINLDAAVGIPTPTDRPKNYYFISKDEYNLLKKKLT